MVGDGEGEGVCALTFALTNKKNTVAAKRNRLMVVLALGISLRDLGGKVRAAYPNRLFMSIIFLVE